MRVLNSLSEINVSRILRLVWLEKKISRVDIATRLGMDKSTVTKIISDLTSKRIIREAESGESGPQGGRKPVLLELNDKYACVGGIEINPEYFYCTLVDYSGKIIFEYSENIKPEIYATLGLLGYFSKAFEILKSNSISQNINLIGIGCGLPALIDVESGKIIQSIPLLINEPIDFTNIAEKIAGVKVLFDNDARCCCYSEQLLWRNISDAKNMMYVMVQHRAEKPVLGSPKNISVGFGFVLNGKIFHGASSTAGEFRSVFWNGSNQTQFLNDSTCIENFNEEEKILPIFDELSKNVAFLVNTLNLDIVYVGGIEREYAEKIVNMIHSQVEHFAPYKLNQTAFINPGMISKKVVAVGAATMFLEKHFSVPDLSN